jgi:ribonuclease P protein component
VPGVGGGSYAPKFAKLPALRRRPDFLRVQAQGRRFRRRYLALLVAPGEQGARVGLTVSRKVGNAVVRNRTRRRLREILRTNPEALCSDCDHVVVAYPAAADAGFDALRKELTWLLDKARGWASARRS